MSKRILVMMSTYNGEKHLKEQLDSILQQKGDREVCLLVRDDGSKDGTWNILCDYEKQYADRIRLMKGENVGYNASFFQLLHAAEGYDYYAFSDQDDVWLEDKLQIACDAIDREAASGKPLLYASPSFLVHDDLKPYGTTRKKERDMAIFNTVIQNICPGHTQVMNNALLSLLKREIDTSRIYVYDSWVTNIANLYGKILFDNEAHTYYRQYEGNQLGSGVGRIGQLFASLGRNKTGDGLKYRKQVEYFLEQNADAEEMRPYKEELQKFTGARKFGKRFAYAFKGKLYRQKKYETFALYLAIVLGRF